MEKCLFSFLLPLKRKVFSGIPNQVFDGVGRACGEALRVVEGLQQLCRSSLRAAHVGDARSVTLGLGWAESQTVFLLFCGPLFF